MMIVWIIGFALGATLIGFDLIIDAKSGATLKHLWAEITSLGIFVAGIIFSIRQWYHLKRKYITTRQNLKAANDEAKSWKDKHEQLIAGLSHGIDDQFSKWELTKSEKEIALLIIKGLSHKEIADIRNSTEKTVRTHATTIYQKSGMNGRAELSAFFLEDILAPLTNL